MPQFCCLNHLSKSAITTEESQQILRAAALYIYSTLVKIKIIQKDTKTRTPPGVCNESCFSFQC